MWAYSDKRVRIVLLGAVLALGLPAVSSPSFAQPTQAEINSAKAAFNAGLALEAAGDYAQALGRFREVIPVKATPQALFHIGRCLENLGKWTEAVGMYRLAVEKAEGVSEASAKQQAEAARVSLEPRLPKLVIERGRGAEGAAITLDGVALGSTAIGNPMPADPGPHLVTATIRGKPAINFDFVLAESETKRLPIDLDAVPPAATSNAPAVEEAPSNTLFTRRNGYYVGAGGVGGLVLGTVFLVLRQSAVSKLDDQCSGSRCPESLQGTYDRAKAFTILGDAFLGLGVVGVGLGTYMILKGKREDATPTSTSTVKRLWVAPVGPSGMGASVGGVF
jgi:tetratricopeptide (TPR) repeat protein